MLKALWGARCSMHSWGQQTYKYSIMPVALLCCNAVARQPFGCLVKAMPSLLSWCTVMPQAGEHWAGCLPCSLTWCRFASWMSSMCIEHCGWLQLWQCSAAELLLQLCSAWRAGRMHVASVSNRMPREHTSLRGTQPAASLQLHQTLCCRTSQSPSSMLPPATWLCIPAGASRRSGLACRVCTWPLTMSR